MPSLAQGKRTAILGIDLRTAVVIHNHLIVNCYPGIIGCKFVDAVFGDIIQSLAPSIEEILLQDTTAIEKLSRFVDIYLEKFIQEPSLPLFIMMEIHRDAAHLVDTASRLDIRQYVSRIASYLTSEMECGHIRKVPLYTIFYTFFGLLTYPFLTRNLFSVLFNGSPDDFESVVRRWKPYVMMHIADMLDAGAKEKEPETAT